VGAGVTATDDGTRTVVTIPGGGGAGAVTSVFTRIGDVIAASGDYTAAQVTNAVSILGSYANPGWITSLAYSKLTGVPTTFTPAAHVHAAADTTSGIFAVARLGSGTPSASNWLRGDGAWTALPASAVTSVFTRTGAVIAASGDYTAAQVTNAVSVLGSYPDPAWITSLAYAKITGAPAAGVPTSRQVIAGTGLSGGGALTADVTLNALPMIASGASGRGGTVPTPGTTAGITKYLREDASWAAPPGTSQTPWLSNIEGAAFNLNNVGQVQTNYIHLPFSAAPAWDTASRLWAEGGFGTRYDGYNHGFDVGGTRTRAVTIQSTGNVGIGTAGPAYQLQLSTDSAAKPTTSAWTIASDARVKRDVKDLQGGLDIIAQLRPIEATYNGLAGTPEGTRVLSFIAQEIEQVLPGTVSKSLGKLSPDDPEEVEILGVNIHECLMHAILAIKQLKAKVEALEAAAATP
jgi:hypothetical protein